MAEIKWIKITVDMFENRKIKHLRKLPNGNNVVLIWIMLLTIAGRCNAGGLIFLTEDIPYTTKMLADEMDMRESIVEAAIKSLAKFNMIEISDHFIRVTGWDEYQNIDGMSRVRNQNRKRVAKYREKQKASEFDRYSNAHCNVTGNVTGNVTVTDGNGTDKDKEEERDKELDTAIAVTPNPCACNAPDQRPSFDTVEAYVTGNLLPLSPVHMDELAEFKNELPEELIRHAIDESCAAGVRKWNYARKVMESYRDNGYKTVGEAKAAKDARKPKSAQNGQTQAANYQQHNYSDSDFDDDFFYDPAKDYGDAK